MSFIRPLGYKPDPPDSRDVLYGVGASVGSAKLPEEFSLAHLHESVGGLWQTISESCVIQVAANACRLTWEDRYGMGKDTPVPARLAAYYIARAAVGDQHVNTGTFPRFAFAALSQAGFTTEDVLPFDEARINFPIPASVTRTMVDQEGALQYKRIVDGEGCIEEMKHACAVSKRGTGIAIPVNDEFDDYDGGVFNPTSAVRGVRGWHYVLVLGYSDEKQAFLCANSWQGHGIQRNGCSYCWVSYAAVQSICQDRYTLFPSKLPSHLNLNQGL